MCYPAYMHTCLLLHYYSSILLWYTVVLVYRSNIVYVCALMTISTPIE